MAKWHGVVGYIHEQVETAPGVWENQIVRKQYYGDVVKNSRRLSDGETIHDDVSVTNSISIVADAYANEHFFAIRFLQWAGAYWKVTEVDASQRPRLLLRMGGVYNGPTS